MNYKLLDGIQFIKLEGSVLQSESVRIDRYFSEILASDSKNVIVDLTEANHISSAVLGQLVFIRKKLQKESGDIKLIITDEDLQELFDLTVLNKVFEIFQSTDRAIESYKLS